MLSRELVSLLHHQSWSVIIKCALTVCFGVCLAKYALDNLRKEKGLVSKAVAAKKKADKKADISAESAQSKALDEQIKEQETKTKDVTSQAD